MPFVALQGRSLQSATIGYAITPNPVRPKNYFSVNVNCLLRIKMYLCIYIMSGSRIDSYTKA